MTQVHSTMEKAYESWYHQAANTVSENSYVHTDGKRVYMKCTFTVCCMPCICYSLLVRLLLCPFTCGKSIGGTSCTEQSDNCISTTFKEIDRKVSFTSIIPANEDLKWVASDPSKQKQVKGIFMKFVEKFIISSMYQKYKMCDWATRNLRHLGYNLEFELTPDVVITVINQMFRNVQE